MFWPSAKNMVFFCSRVCSVLMAMGTESGLASMKNVLPLFFRLMGILTENVDYGLCGRVDRTFPRALVISGWRHAVDNVLRDSIYSLSLFARWLTDLKAAMEIGIVVRPPRTTCGSYCGCAEVSTEAAANGLEQR